MSFSDQMWENKGREEITTIKIVLLFVENNSNTMLHRSSRHLIIEILLTWSKDLYLFPVKISVLIFALTMGDKMFHSFKDNRHLLLHLPSGKTSKRFLRMFKSFKDIISPMLLGKWINSFELKSCKEKKNNRMS